MHIFLHLIESDASIKIKNTNFTSGHQFTLGIPISVAYCERNKYDYGVIPFICYISKSYWIYSMLFYMNGDADYKHIDEPCIVHYI